MATVVIDRFLGLHQDSTGDTNLKVGELAECKNIRITEDYNARKREGYIQLFNSIAAKKIQGMWYGSINGTYHFLFACNGHIYKKNNDNTYTNLGTLTDDVTTFFGFSDYVYIQNGHEYYKWTGTGSISVVAGYRPKVAIATPPAGGGTLFEQINILTGAKHQTFSPDGIATAFQLLETNITSLDFVYVNGVLKTVGVDYTVNLVTGIVTFTLAPATGIPDNIDIGWTKGTGQRSLLIAHHYYDLFGGQNDTRVFLYGDGTNRMIYSELADGVPSAEYFPANNFQLIGSNSPITYVTKHYDRQVIYTKANAWYSTYSFDETNGASFPVYPLNDKIGNIPMGQGQLVLNNPFTITTGLYQWQSTSVRDERNAVFMSERVHLGLTGFNLANAITYDYEALGELWICVNNEVYIYSYRYDVWYRFVLYDTPSSFIEVDGVLYFGTNNGQIMKFDTAKLTDNGHVIISVMETGFLDFGQSWRRKFLNFAWVGLQPETRSFADIEWQSDYSASQSPEELRYNLIDFGNVDYSDYSFDVNYNPQPFRLKLKAKKFTYFKLIITNESLIDTMTILSINLPAEIGGMSK